MDTIVSLLSKTSLTTNESQIYLHLLKNPGETVYEIAKKMHVSRSSIYPTIEKMLAEGMIILESSQKDLYYAKDPIELLNQLETKQQDTIQSLRDILPKIQIEPKRSPYLNMIGFDSIIGKARTMLYESKHEVYMNTDLPLELFDDAFDLLNQRGIDVFVFTFSKTNYKKPNVFIYTHDIQSEIAFRLMLVSDFDQVLVANNDFLRNEWQATYTKNELMIRIVTEHIHHDIYLKKLKDKHQKSLFEVYPDLAIQTKAEKRTAFTDEEKNAYIKKIKNTK